MATAGLLTLIWGSTWAGVRISLEGFAPFLGVALRFGLAGAILLTVAWISGVEIGRTRSERWLWLVQALFTYCMSYCVVYWGQQWVPTGLTSILFSTFPLFVMLFAFLLLPGERLGRVATLGMLIGFAGVALIFSEDFDLFGGPQVFFAAAVVLLSPLSAAIAQVMVKRWGQHIHSVSLNAVPMLVAAGIMAGLSAVVESDRPMTPTPSAVAAVLYLAIVGSAVAFSLYFWLLQHVEATRVSLIAYGVPVVAVTVGVLAFDEPLTVRTVIGAVLVITGVAFAARR